MAAGTEAQHDTIQPQQRERMPTSTMPTSFIESAFTSRTEYDAWLGSLDASIDAVRAVLKQLRLGTEATGGTCVADGGTTRDRVVARLGQAQADAVLSTFPFGGMIKAPSMLFTQVDDPTHIVAPSAYKRGCSGGDGFLLKHAGKLFVMYVDDDDQEVPHGRYVFA